MAVAATFLTVSATSALAAQSTTPRANAAELAIDAAVPRPEPANVPPPTVGDFKMDTTATVPDTAKAIEKPADLSPAAKAAEPTVTAPAARDAATATPPAATAIAPAAEPAKEPVKVSTVAPADQPVADRLRDMLGAKSLRYFDRKNERAAVEKFYSARDYAPQWTQAGKLTDSGKGVIARLKDAASEGLNAADYPVPDFAAAGSPDQLAEAELKLTASMLDYARQAQSGRMHWSQVSADIQYPEHPTDPAEVLANISTAKDASAALDGYNPPHKLYKDLKAKLAELRGQGDGPMIHIAEGPALAYKAATKKQGEVVPEDPRVPQLRAKLGVTEHPDGTQYDAKVAAAVRKFQESVDLNPSGVLDDRTVKAINSPKRDRQIDTVLVNMERWRWLPRQLGASSLGNAYVILNVPDFTLKVMQNGAQVWNTRVVTGKPGKHATPMLTETMKFITVNPTWNVPPSIIYNEYLPALQQDPTVLQRMGLKLERNRDGSIHISQPPGEANALGRVRFNFPNKFLVYQHDTPDKHLFAKEERAFSHGCMRVQESGPIRRDPAQHHDAERALHAGKDPQHVRPQRDRPEIPDADPGQHHLSDRVRRRRRQAANPQGHLWPRLRDDRLAQEQPQQGSRGHGRPCATELLAPVRLEPARRRELRQRQHLFLRSVVLRAPVRRPVDRDAAGPGRPPPATAVHQVIRRTTALGQNFRMKSTISPTRRDCLR